jgi:hypothetical protein
VYDPEWKGPLEGYVVNTLTKQYWKVARTLAYEDCMQEAYVVFLRCRRKYPRLKEAKHFMALFKTAWYRQFINLANADTAYRIFGPMPTNVDGEPYEQVGELDNDGFIACVLREAPGEIRMIISLFLGAPQELLEAALGEGGSERINRLLGLPRGFDSLEAVRQYFTA